MTLSLDQMDILLREWEVNDGLPWTDEDRLEGLEALEKGIDLDFKAWKDFISKVPDDLEQRYRKIVQMLLDKKLITGVMAEAELKAMGNFGHKVLMRRGKEFSDWFRSMTR